MNKAFVIAVETVYLHQKDSLGFTVVLKTIHFNNAFDMNIVHSSFNQCLTFEMTRS